MTTLAPTAPAVALASPAALLRELFRREPLFAATALLLVLAIVPIFAAGLVDPRLFNGVPIWEKPLKFAIALAVYMATLAWFAGWLPKGTTTKRWYRWYSAIVVICIAGEMAWIGGAAANGTGSHFNVATPAMSVIYGLMGAFAVTLTSASLVYGILIHRNGANGLSPAFRLSVSSGLVLTFVLTVLVAGFMSSNGGHWVGGNPSDAEAAALMGWARDGGDLRVAHFFATHAMHFIPAFGLVSALLFSATDRRPVMAFAALFTAFSLYTFFEALAGRPFLPGLL